MIRDLQQERASPGLRRRPLLPGPTALRHIAWSPDGNLLAAGFVDGGVGVWDLRRRSECSPLWAGRHSRYPVKAVSWAPGGGGFATCDGQTICVWNPEDGMPRRIIDVPSRRTAGLAWAADGRRLSLVRITSEFPKERQILETWDATNGDLLETREGPGWDRCYIGISAEARFLAFSLTSGEVEVWDLSETRLVTTLPGGYQRLTSIALSSDSKTCVLACDNGSVEVWSLPRRERLRALTESLQAVYSLAFSADGNVLAGKSRDGTVRLWWCANWEKVAEIRERSGQDYVELAFDAGRRLATFDRMNTAVRVWELDMETLRLESHPTIRILFLAADPLDAPSRLRIGEEIREITEQLKLASLRDRFDFRQAHAVRPRDLSRALLEEDPHIVQFSGHGSRDGAIYLEDKNGRRHPVSPRALTGLFETEDNVQCVVLNACYSQAQASAIARHVKYVIGMRVAVQDRAAISFSVGFYQALGEGRSIEVAFKKGCSQIDLENLPDFHTPIFWKDGEIVAPAPTPESPPSPRFPLSPGLPKETAPRPESSLESDAR